MNSLLVFLSVSVIGAIIWAALRIRSRQNSAAKSRAVSGLGSGVAASIDASHLDEQVCPYCAFTFETPPKRNRKCPACGETIRVSTREGYIRLFTEEGWIKYQAEFKAINFRNRWLRELDAYGTSEREFVKAHKIFRDKNDFAAKDSDIIWGLFNKTLLKQKDHHSMKMVYLSMSRFLYEEGRDHLQVARQAEVSELRDYLANGCKKVEVLVSADACETCQKLAGRVFTIKNALKHNPLPCEGCTFQPSATGRGWCRCCYLPVVE